MMPSCFGSAAATAALSARPSQTIANLAVLLLKGLLRRRFLEMLAIKGIEPPRKKRKAVPETETRELGVIQAQWRALWVQNLATRLLDPRMTHAHVVETYTLGQVSLD